MIRLEDEFADNFVRVHRNCLVASAALMGLERTGAEESKEDSWQVILPGLDERIPVSRRQLPLIKKVLKPKSQL